MDVLLFNYGVLERLVQFLAVADVVVLCSISREWRDVLGREMLWRRVARREGEERENDYLANKYGEYVAVVKRSGLMPLCRSFFITVYPSYVRKKWRSGERRTRYMDVPTELRKDITVYFDVCQEFVVLGIVFGSFTTELMIWR